MTALTDAAGQPTQEFSRPSDNWRALAACRGTDTDVFYPEGRGRTLRIREARAKEICRGCPVAAQCREVAASQPERFGIWGGLTQDERGWSPTGQQRFKGG